MIKKEEGYGLLDFALIFPIFFLMIIFIIEIGWVTYQQTVFDQGYMYSGWTITAEDVGDYDLLEETPSQKIYENGTAKDLKEALEREIEASSLWGMVPGNLTVADPKAKLYNQEEKFHVPGWTPSDTDSVEAINRTRYMELEADLTYDIYPLTYVGQMLFGPKIVAEKRIMLKRVVRSLHRSE